MPLFPKLISCLCLQIRLPFNGNRSLVWGPSRSPSDLPLKNFVLLCSRSSSLKSLNYPPVKIPSGNHWWPSLFSPEDGLALKNMAYHWNARRELVVTKFTFFQNHRGNFSEKTTLPKGPWSFWESVKMNIAIPCFPCIFLNTYYLPHSPLLTHTQWNFVISSEKTYHTPLTKIILCVTP